MELINSEFSNCRWVASLPVSLGRRAGPSGAWRAKPRPWRRAYGEQRSARLDKFKRFQQQLAPDRVPLSLWFLTPRGGAKPWGFRGTHWQILLLGHASTLTLVSRRGQSWQFFDSRGKKKKPQESDTLLCQPGFPVTSQRGTGFLASSKAKTSTLGNGRGLGKFLFTARQITSWFSQSSKSNRRVCRVDKQKHSSQILPHLSKR